MKLAIFMGFADTVMWNALSVTVKNKIIKTAGFFIHQTIQNLQD